MTLRSVWHYTDGAGFQGIVSNDTLWATSFRHLNDSQEAQYATAVLQEAAEVQRPLLDPSLRPRFDDMMYAAKREGLNLFLLCAAQEPNLLTVWRGYGGEVSYAVELDASVRLLPVQRSPLNRHPFPPKRWEVELDETDDGVLSSILDPDRTRFEITEWAAVHYDTGDAARRVQTIAELAAAEPNFMNDLMTPSFELRDIRLLQLKNPDFRDEREARMIFDVSPRWKFVHHRSGMFGMTPYIQVSADSGTNKKNSYDSFLECPGRLPIVSVTIGPTPLGDEAISSTREFLEFNGYPDVPVYKSTIPFR